MANAAVKAAITRDPILVDLALQGGGRMGHLLGACSIVCSRSRGLESMVFPAHRRGR
jgi:hypothetical protein